MKRAKRQTYQLGWLDFSLSAFASCLAVYSVGMGLRIPEISWFLCGWIAVGTAVSFVLCRVVPEKYTWVSGLLYSMVSVGSVAYVQTLNGWLPKGGFPVQLIIAASLAYMLLFGSFLTWRDSTIVFQAVPSIALFGLVGAWDTFTGAPFAFFGFLLCFATLFARAHGRVMMMQAEDSGYNPLAQNLSVAESSSSTYETLKKGPWRWMAGPEWALGSAAVIVLLSVLGAPVLQTSVQGVAGFVQIQVPQVAPTLSATSASFNQNQMGNVNVGQGPRGNLRRAPVFKAKISDLDEVSGQAKLPYYFRVRTYGIYTGRGWQPIGDYPSRNLMSQGMEDPGSFMNRSRSEIDPYDRLQFDLELLGPMSEGVPVPGDVEFLGSGQFYVRRADGMLRQGDNSSFQSGVNGIFRVPKRDQADPVKTVRIDSSYLEDPDRRITDRVRGLAAAIVESAKTDYEKAQRIKTEIGIRTVYDLQAPGVPAGSDPADWFLFEGKKGYCDLFATSMTVLARAAGLPARYVTGYYPALGVREGGRMVLHESEAHAWSEIFFEGRGWVVFDATEGARDVGLPTADEALMDKGWFRGMAFTIGGLLVVAVPLLVSYLIRLKRGPKDVVQRAIGSQYNRFVGALEKRSGKPKRPSQTPREYLNIVAPLLTVGVPEAEQMTQRFEAILYAPEGVDESEMGSLRDQVSATMRALASK